MTRYKKYKDPYKIDFNRLSIYGNLRGRDKGRKELEVGSEFTVKVTDMDMEGRGVADLRGFTVVIPRAVPGEKVTIRVTKVVRSKKIAYASVVKRVEEPKR